MDNLFLLILVVSVVLILGYFADMAAEKIYVFFKNKYRQSRIKDIIGRVENNNHNLRIHSLDRLEDYYEPENIYILKSRKKFFVDFPADMKLHLANGQRTVVFRQDVSLDGSSNFKDIEKETGIENLPQLIEKHRRIAAKAFIDKYQKGLIHSNTLRSGILDFDFGARYDSYDRWVLDVSSRLNLEVFQTDLFTNLVFKSIYQELCDKDHPIAKATDPFSIKQYRAFLTSFRINTFLIINSRKGNKIVFGRGSKEFKIPKEKSKWRTTMDKFLMPTEYHSNRVCILNCLYQGLYEHLGLEKKYKDYIIEEKFYDLFLDRENFELGITSTIKFNWKFNKLLEGKDPSQNSSLKLDEVRLVPFTRKALGEFIKENKENLTSSCLYALNMISARNLILPPEISQGIRANELYYFIG